MTRFRLLPSLPVAVALCASPLLALAQSPTTPAPAVRSGLEGSIFISPVLGGPTRQGMPDAKPLPQIEFIVRQGDRVVTTFRTDDDGRFRVTLPPGRYTVERKDKMVSGFYGPFQVEVAPATMKTVQWKCDSGIR
jgi:hypothetical protein